jgi:FG-GAP-like repeat/EGF-like domain/TGF-beta propeptide
MQKKLLGRDPWSARRRTLALASLSFLAVPFAGIVGGGCAADLEPGGEVVGEAEQQLTTCITVQRGTSGVVGDTTISQSAGGQNFGALPTLKVTNQDEALLQFALGSIPSNALVSSATLRLYVTDSLSPLPISVRNVLVPWDEGTATYGSINQQLAPEISATLMPVSGVKWQSVNVQKLVQKWVSGAVPNYGLSLDQMFLPQATKASNFVSSEGTFGAEYHPALDVCYQTPDDHCTPNPCQNGGSCVNGWDGYTCSCPAGFQGANCETAIPAGPCAPAPCQNGGICIEGASNYTCQCQNGWSGPNCTVYSVGDPHTAMAPTTADLDHDGKADVLIANAEAASAANPSGSLSVLRGTGTGTLLPESYYVGAPLASNAVVAADLNGDGWDDAITVNGQTNLGSVNGSISVYLNQGASAPGQLSGPTTFTTGTPGSIHLCAGDFNGDGFIDIATTSVTANKVSVLFGDGAGGFDAPQLIAIVATGGAQSSIGTADFNGDGQLDLAVTSPSSARLSILLNQGNGAFSAPVAYSNSKNGQTAGLAFGDFDGDGKLDIASNGAAGAFVFFFKGNGNGTFATGQASTASSSAVANSALGIVAGDFSGDGKLDAYVLRSTAAGGILPMTGNGSGAFTAGTLIPTGSSPAVNAITTADLDSNGHLDVVVTNRSSGTVSLILNPK